MYGTGQKSPPSFILDLITALPVQRSVSPFLGFEMAFLCKIVPDPNLWSSQYIFFFNLLINYFVQLFFLVHAYSAKTWVYVFLSALQINNPITNIKPWINCTKLIHLIKTYKIIKL